MSLARISIGLFGIVALVAATIAGTTIWLMLTDPVTVADAVNEGNVSPLVRALAGALYDAFKGILRYL
jgi:multidrug resistance efflux pump